MADVTTATEDAQVPAGTRPRSGGPVRDDAEAGTPDLGRTADMFRALGDPTRLAIYELIRETESAPHDAHDLRQSVSELASHFDVSLSTVSHHLKELRRAGLIRCERRGQTIYCSTSAEGLDAIRRYVER